MAGKFNVQEHLEKNFDIHHIQIGWTDGDQTLVALDDDEDLLWVLRCIHTLNNDILVVPTERDPAYEQNATLVLDIHGHYDDEDEDGE